MWKVDHKFQFEYTRDSQKLIRANVRFHNVHSQRMAKGCFENQFTVIPWNAKNRLNVKLVSWRIELKTARTYVQSGFSQTHKIGNITIFANFVFPYICSFLLYLQHMMLVNMKLDISWCNRITFQGCKLYWFLFNALMAQIKKINTRVVFHKRTNIWTLHKYLCLT